MFPEKPRVPTAIAINRESDSCQMSQRQENLFNRESLFECKVGPSIRSLVLLNQAYL